MNDSHIIYPEDGLIIYNSTESVLSDTERQLMDIINGKIPTNDFERKLKENIEEIKSKNHIIDIPFM